MVQLTSSKKPQRLAPRRIQLLRPNPVHWMPQEPARCCSPPETRTQLRWIEVASLPSLFRRQKGRIQDAEQRLERGLAIFVGRALFAGCEKNVAKPDPREFLVLKGLDCDGSLWNELGEL